MGKTETVAVLFALALCVPSRAAWAAQDVSKGGRVTTDLFTEASSPPGALLDGDPKTYYCQHRMQDAEFRVWLAKPSTVESVIVVQDIDNWSVATSLEFEAADGSVVTVPVQMSSKAQTLPVSFPTPTAFLDVHVVKATPAADGGGWGGFAALTVLGTFAGGDNVAPSISNVVVTPVSATSATVAWATSEPSTSQIRYSTEETSSTLLPPDPTLTTDHSVTIDAPAALAGRIELRSADAAGNRAEQWVEAFSTVGTPFSWGVGGWTFQINGQWQHGSDVYQKDQLAVNLLQEWVGDEDWSSWLKPADVAQVHGAGYTPEIIHLWLSGKTVAEIIARKADFFADIDRLADTLAQSGVGADALVTLEPEFNQNDVTTWDGWNDIMIQAINVLHSKTQAKVGLLPGDWDISHQIELSMGRAAAKADFIGFQEMRSENGGTVDDAHQTVSRAIQFSHFLSRKFLRPVRWGYLMISDYNGWLGVQRDVVVEMCERQQELEAAGTVSVSWMGYLDTPGATGAGGESEAHHGLKYADNTPKPAFYVYKECVAHGASWVANHTSPPGEIPKSGCSCEVAGGGDAGEHVGIGVVAGLIGLIRVRRRRREPAGTGTWSREPEPGQAGGGRREPEPG